MREVPTGAEKESRLMDTKSTSPDVSVIIPTYRRPQPLLEAIRSVLDQEGVAVEVLVMDDSPEGSASPFVEQLADPRVTYRQMPQPTGGNPSLVRNTAWPLARGRYLHFLDDDDLVAAGAHREMVRALDARPDVGVAFGRLEPFGDNPAVLEQQRRFFERAARRAARVAHSRFLTVATLLFRETLFVGGGELIRRECVPQLGGFDNEMTLAEDVEFYTRAIREFGAVFVDRTVLHYRTGAPSITHNLPRDSSRWAESYQRTYEKYRQQRGVVEFSLMRLVARCGLVA
jgi:glycosyltransferase involved in cell wall biosynthesis